MDKGRIFAVILFIIVIGLAFFNNYISVSSDIEVDAQIIGFNEYKN